jgi:hypothetical protein
MDWCKTDVLVQVSSDFGICHPVLQALQEERFLTPPFGETIFHAGGNPAVEYIAAPEWQNDVEIAGWVQGRYDAMDPAQRSAFDHALSRKVALIQGPPGNEILQSSLRY